MTDFVLPPEGGILFVDKSEGWTSHDVVAKSRRALGTRKVGHAGTLDPMATGLLILGAGPSTRLLTYLVGLDKTYETTIRLGASTITDDREGEVVETASADVLAEVGDARIAEEVAALTGDIEQAPSAVSAIKVDGRRAYDRVRAGEDVELKKRPVTIHSFKISEIRRGATGEGVPFIDVDAAIRCSSGTYIRALARDLGAVLGTGGHLTALRRTRVGAFSVSDAASIEDIAEGRTPAVLAPEKVASALFPVLRLNASEAKDLSDGKRLEIDSERCADTKAVAAVEVEEGTGIDARLVGIVEVKRGRTRVLTNFPVPSAPPAPRTPTSAA